MIPHTAALLYEVIANKEAEMPLKPRIKVKAEGRQISCKEFIEVMDEKGKVVIKRNPKRKGTLQQQYASKNRKRWMAAK